MPKHPYGRTLKPPKKIIVLFVPVGKPPEVRVIEGQLEQMQALVGGDIQMVPIPHGCELVCNENGIAEKLPFNRMEPLVYGSQILGDFFITRTHYSGGSQSLTKKNIDLFTKRYA